MSESLKQFVQIEKKVRHCKSLQKLAYVITNLTHELVPYNQAVVWKKTVSGIQVFNISATSLINRQSPYVVWLEKTFLPEILVSKISGNITFGALSSDLQEECHEHLPKFAHHYALSDKAGVLFFANQPWTKEQDAYAKELIDVYQQQWHHLDDVRKMPRILPRNMRTWAILGVSLLVVLCLPVQLTILAQAEVIPEDPLLVGSSIEGVIKEVYVKPNQEVKKGEVLFSLDDVELTNQVELAKKDLLVAKERYRRAYQDAYDNQQSKAEIAVLKEEVGIKEQALKHKRQLLNRSEIKAQESGVVIFTSKNDWLGKPISIGERVMLLADGKGKQLEINVPANDMLEITRGDKVNFFANTNPLHSISASVDYASFIATTNSQDELVYHVIANFSADEELPRYGIKGTAKIYGHRVTLFYYLFRRPLIYLQSYIGA